MMQRAGIHNFALALLVLAATRAGAADDVDEARRGIAAGNELLMKAIEAQDAPTIAALYTKDAVVLPDRGEMIVGSQTGIEALWKEQFAAGVKKFTLETTNVERGGDLAVETGRFKGVIQPEGKPVINAVGKYLVVWKREDKGAWKLHRDIWNSDPAPAAAETTASAQ